MDKHRQSAHALPVTATLARQQFALLILLTLVWGVNWPVIKLGVSDYPPLTVRALSLLLGVPVLALGLVVPAAALAVLLLWHEVVNLSCRWPR